MHRTHQLSNYTLQRTAVVVVILLCAALGNYLLRTSHAASPFASSEAESGSLSTNATLNSDNNASGGKAVQFGFAQQFGYSVHIEGLSDAPTYLQLAVGSNATTVRDDFAWPSIEPTRGTYVWTNPDKIMTQATEAGLSVLGIADYSPSWDSVTSGANYTEHSAPTSAADYAAFTAQLAMRYGKNGTFWKANPNLTYHPLAGIELWNEPNLSSFTSNGNNEGGAGYAALVKAAYPAIKAVDPTITVVAGALAPYGPYGQTSASAINPITFLQQMYAAGAGGYFDALSMHPYNFAQGLTATEMLSDESWSGWSQMVDTNPSLRSVMIANGDSNKKIWITEMGAPTYSGGVSQTEQANLATQVVALWKSYSWAGNFYWYDLRDDCTDSTNDQCNFGVVEANDTPKPAYAALTQAYQ
jgi:polysaccharide biosynthesis protein PslG